MVYSISSIALGLIACFLPIIALFKKSEGRTKSQLSLLSWVCCSGALLIQLMHLSQLAQIGDFASIEDTINVIATVSLALIALVFVLNLLVLFRSRRAYTS